MMFDLNHGWQTFISFRWLWVIVGAFSVIVACMRAGFDVGGPVLMKEQFDGATSWAIIQTSQAIGFLSGAVLAARIKPSRPLIYCLAVTAVMPLGLLAMALPTPVWVLSVSGFFLGVCFEQWGVMWGTAMQTHIPRDALSRASAFDAMGSLVLGPVGLALAGPIISVFGLRALFIGCAAVTALFLVLPLLEREVWNLRWLDPVAEPELTP